jgi:hypothetical protein
MRRHLSTALSLVIPILLGALGCSGDPGNDSASDSSDLRWKRHCGDGICGGYETCGSCPSDCGPCASDAGLNLDAGADGQAEASSDGASPDASRDASADVTSTDSSAPADASLDVTPPDAADSSTDYTGLFLGASMQGLSLGAITPAGTNNAWQNLQGTDAKYGDRLPRAPAALFGGTAGYTDGIQLIGATGATVNAIQTDSTVPAGVSSQVLAMTMVQPYDNASMQNMYLTFPDQSVAQGMVYTSRWVWLQPDLPSRGGFWMEIAESKTPDPCERFQLGIVMESWTGFGATTPIFQLLHDQITTPWQYYAQTGLSPTGITSGQYGIGQTYKAPVPLGRWFRAEFAFNRNDSSGQGWMWFALTDPGSSDPALRAGVQVFAARGPFNYTDNTGVTRTLGMDIAKSSDRINRLFMAASYSNLVRSAASPYTIKYTDIQVWTKWPASATAHPSNYD